MATESLIHRFQDRVLRYFLRQGCEYHDARDLTQESLLAAITRLSSFDPHRSRFESWLFGICRNLLLSFQRASARRVVHLERYGESKGGMEAGPATSLDYGVDDPDAQSEETREFERYVSRLPAKLREAMDWMVLGLPTPEIAKRLGISEAGARRRIRIATRKIRALWERDRRKE